MGRAPNDRPYLSPGQAARILGVSPKTVNRWANQGRIPCAVTLGGHRRFPAEAIRAVAVSMGLEESRPSEDGSETGGRGPNDDHVSNGKSRPGGDGAK